jgi:hypothetical protein
MGFWVHQWDVLVRDTIDFSYVSPKPQLVCILPFTANALAFEWVYIGGLLYNSAVAPIKVAIVMEWMRIFCPHVRNYFYWTCQVIMWLNIVYYTCAMIIEAAQCIPQEKIWDPTVLEGSCLDTKKAVLTTASVNVVSDLVIFLAPQRVIWSLQLTTRKKIGVAVVFSVGLL